ncbi:hypothetical protein MBRA_03544 [Methylobacterium brachiatum]|nr:hypothetical protein MBRA_03544 [Methylobacterium brachiatum]
MIQAVRCLESLLRPPMALPPVFIGRWPIRESQTRSWLWHGAADETGAAADQVLDAASELSRQSEHLAAEVERFLHTVRAA